MASRTEKQTFFAAISPCPNDSYVFGAWVLGMAGDIPGRRTRFIWEDVQTLNEMAASGRGDLIKVSAVQALRLEQDYFILDSGGAWGLQHGPKLVALNNADARPSSIAVPGLLTTAHALLKAWADFDFEPVPMAFDQIPAAVVEKQVAAGLLIHETGFNCRNLGLEVLTDFNVWWKDWSKGLPLPLGLIVMKRSLGETARHQAEAIIRKSILLAENNAAKVLPFISSLARELDPDVVDEHIKAYVNQYSLDMGVQGKSALSFLKKIS